MRKIYSTFAFSIITFFGMAQLTLTKAANEPVLGDIYQKMEYDSTGSVPKNTGAGVLWNFTTLSLSGYTETSTYTTVASTPSPAVYPGATLAENQGGTNYTMYKSTGSNFEVQGLYFPGAAINFSNTGVFAIWPISMGYNNYDIAGGSATSGTVTSVINASINVNAAGTGTIMLPNNITLPNILQTIQTITVSQISGTITQNFVQTHYDYYSGLQKFPVLSVQYKTTGGAVTSFVAFLNKNLIAGIASHDISTGYNVYPNPAKDLLAISFNNTANAAVNVIITNLVGETVKSVSLGNETSINSCINVADLSKGIYLMNVKAGATSSVKKIIIE